MTCAYSYKMLGGPETEAIIDFKICYYTQKLLILMFAGLLI